MSALGGVGGARVLIAEDERHLGTLLEHYLAGRGHAVTLVADGRAALDALERTPFDVALLDVQMPKLDGVAVLRTVRAMPAPPEVIVMTGNGTVDVALTAMQHGAYDYVTKPYRMAEVDLVVVRAAERRRLEREHFAHGLASAEIDDAALETVYAPLQAVLDAVDRAAPSASALLVTGEPGTGHGSLARRFHRASAARPDAIFVSVDAARIGADAALGAADLPKLAAGGTLHVARIDALAHHAQDALAGALAALAALDDAGTSARLVATSARDARSLRLAPALASRLESLRAELPPLRARHGDVALLAERYIRRFASASPPAMAASAVDRLVAHAWPGNVPELRAVVERAVARAADAASAVIDIDHLGLP